MNAQQQPLRNHPYTTPGAPLGEWLAELGFADVPTFRHVADATLVGFLTGGNAQPMYMGHFGYYRPGKPVRYRDQRLNTWGFDAIIVSTTENWHAEVETKVRVIVTQAGRGARELIVHEQLASTTVESDSVTAIHDVITGVQPVYARKVLKKY